MKTDEKLRFLQALVDAGKMSAEEYQNSKSKLSGVSGVERQIASYLLLSEVEEGVFRAKHTEELFAAAQGGEVYIRFIDPQTSERNAFVHEVSLQWKCRHDNLLPVYNLISEGGQLAVVCAKTKTFPLRGAVPKNGMSRDEAMKILTPLADLLDYLHGLGIVIRQLDMDTIQLDESRNPLLMELGFYREAEHGLSATHKWMLEEARQLHIREDLMAWAILAQQLMRPQEPAGKAIQKRDNMPLRVISAAFGLPDTDNLSAFKLDSCSALLASVEQLLPSSSRSKKRAPVTGVKLTGFEAKTSFSPARIALGKAALDFILLPGGRFRMMDREVTITQPFFISRYPVTQAFYHALTGKNPSHFRGPLLPIERVSWAGTLRFCNALSEVAGLEGGYRIGKKRSDMIDDVMCFRLPTEAEWFYAAAAGKNLSFAGGNAVDDLGWYEDNSESTTHKVAQKKPNAWGIYDCSGNVWEWTWDGFEHQLSNTEGELINPTGVESDYRVCRGGSWREGPAALRLDARIKQDKATRRPDLGFRLVCQVL